MTFSQKKIHAAIRQQHTNFFPLVRNAELDSVKKRHARSWTLFFFDAHICPKGILLGYTSNAYKCGDFVNALEVTSSSISIKTWSSDA